MLPLKHVIIFFLPYLVNFTTISGFQINLHPSRINRINRRIQNHPYFKEMEKFKSRRKRRILNEQERRFGENLRNKETNFYSESIPEFLLSTQLFQKRENRIEKRFVNKMKNFFTGLFKNDHPDGYISPYQNEDGFYDSRFGPDHFRF